MKNSIRKICCIGAGYVGGPTMSVIALKCPEIIVEVVDINNDKINKWNDNNLDNLPVYEPGLSEIIKKTRNRNLFFSTDVEKAIDEAEIIFIAVGTPTKLYGKGSGLTADLKYIELSARTIAKVAKDDKIIVEKSTLPVRTAESLKEILTSTGKSGVNFEILSNPEFLAEGTAIDDLLNADRVLVGGDNTKSGKQAKEILCSIYERWLPKKSILTTNVWSSELSKLVANAFLAQRVSSINSISALCEKTDANVDEVAKAIGLDSRIGNKFLNSSVGFGGSCFKKDILNLVYIARSYGLTEVADYWEQVILINDYQRKRFSEKIIEKLYNTVNNKKITFFGWAFKKDTNDSRESSAIHIADALIEEKAMITVYDPKVSHNQMINDLNELKSRDPKINSESLIVSDDPYKAAVNSHAIVILTDWDEFKKYDYKKIYKKMNKPAWIFDGRRALNNLNLDEFKVYTIGN